MRDTAGSEISGVVAASADLMRQRDERSVLRVAVANAVKYGAHACVALVKEPASDWTVQATTGADRKLVADVLIALGYRRAVRPRRGEATVLVARSDLFVVALPTATAGEVVLAATPPPNDVFNDRFDSLLAGLVVLAGAAVDNARSHAAVRHELATRQAALEERDAVARLLQRSLLPPHLPAIPGIDLAAAYLPMTEGIGGDFYDVFPVRGRDWGLVLGDVRGKGPEAASVTALARHTIRTAAMTRRHPRQALQTLNEVLCSRADDDGAFCTAIFGRLRQHSSGVRITAAIAGHPPVVVLRESGEIETHGPTGALLGVIESLDLLDVAIDLAAGDACVLYTDGATDVRHRGGTFGDERLVDVIAGCRAMSAEGIAKSIERAVVDFQDGSIHDDLAVLVVSVPPTAERP